jgi:hypothetical protein
MTTQPTTNWRISSYSTSNGSCVQVGATTEGVAVRNSNHPDAGTITFAPADMAAWIAGVKAGEFDDLA